MKVFDWKHARMRAESNMAFGILLLLLVLLARPFAALTVSLASNSIGPLLIGIVGVAAFVGIARWRQRGTNTVYGLNTVAVALLAYAAVLLMSPQRTTELADSLLQSRPLMAALGVALIAMGYGLRRTYARKELEEPTEEPAEELAAEPASQEE